MTTDEIDQADELYASGLSLAAVGRQLNREASVIRYALLRHRVRLRDSHGRAR
jgi:IS30 family transposase